MKKTVLITGCSTGFGKLTAETFNKNGWNVSAAMRTPEKSTLDLNKDTSLVTRLDVTDTSSIRDSINKTLNKFGSIDVLVNNAAYGGHALFEQFSDIDIRKMYDVNVFGLMSVTREVLPIMRKQKNGVIINITSIAGHFGAPYVSVYGSTKYAVEGFTESLAFEVKDFGIRALTIAPGAFNTNFSVNSENRGNIGDAEIIAHSEKIGSHIANVVRGRMSSMSDKPADSQDVADKIYECAVNENSPVHNIVGFDAEMLMNMKNSMSSQEFLDKVRELIMPK